MEEVITGKTFCAQGLKKIDNIKKSIVTRVIYRFEFTSSNKLMTFFKELWGKLIYRNHKRKKTPNSQSYLEENK